MSESVDHHDEQHNGSNFSYENEGFEHESHQSEGPDHQSSAIISLSDSPVKETDQQGLQSSLTGQSLALGDQVMQEIDLNEDSAPPTAQLEAQTDPKSEKMVTTERTLSGPGPGPTTVVSNGLQPAGRLSFIDFQPAALKRKEWWSFQSTYETFSVLFDKINIWLAANPTWRVKSIETLLSDPSSKFATQKCSFSGKALKRFKRGVRLWLVPGEDSKTAMKVGCINVVPRRIPQDNGQVKQERLDEMLQRINNLLINRPINGKILNLETVEIPIDQEVPQKIDTEGCQFEWDSAGCASPGPPSGTIATDPPPQYVQILRIYFQYGRFTSREVIYVKDFIPTRYMWDAPLAVANYESFASLLQRASAWVRQEQTAQPGFRYCSACTVDSPLEEADFSTLNGILGPAHLAAGPSSEPDSSSSPRRASAGLGPKELVDSQKMFHRLKPYQSLLKFLRITYTVPYTGPDPHPTTSAADNESEEVIEELPTNQNVVLNCKVFTPARQRPRVELVAGPGSEITLHTQQAIPEYDSLDTVRKQMDAWLTITGAKVLSVESGVVKLPYSSSSLATCVDSCLVTSAASCSEGTHWLAVYRVYLDGHYLEPPTRLLPNARTSTGTTPGGLQSGSDTEGGDKQCSVM